MAFGHTMGICPRVCSRNPKGSPRTTVTVRVASSPVAVTGTVGVYRP
jgi:hypothetical protein